MTEDTLAQQTFYQVHSDLRYISNRKLKKYIGHKMFKFLKQFKPNTPISTCSGYNKIATGYYITYRDLTLKRKRFYVEFELANGCTCDSLHCFAGPPWPKEHITKWIKNNKRFYDMHKAGDTNQESTWTMCYDAIHRGEDPFDENGIPKEKYRIKGDIYIDA